MAGWTEEGRRNAIDRAVLKRCCTPKDRAGAILLLGFGVAMVTGQVIVVDGGLTL